MLAGRKNLDRDKDDYSRLRRPEREAGTRGDKSVSAYTPQTNGMLEVCRRRPGEEFRRGKGRDSQIQIDNL